MSRRKSLYIYSNSSYLWAFWSFFVSSICSSCCVTLVWLLSSFLLQASPLYGNIGKKKSHTLVFNVINIELVIYLKKNIGWFMYQYHSDIQKFEQNVPKLHCSWRCWDASNKDICSLNGKFLRREAHVNSNTNIVKHQNYPSGFNREHQFISLFTPFNVHDLYMNFVSLSFSFKLLLFYVYYG